MDVTGFNHLSSPFSNSRRKPQNDQTEKTEGKEQTSFGLLLSLSFIIEGHKSQWYSSLLTSFFRTNRSCRNNRSRGGDESVRPDKRSKRFQLFT